jgi:hypothetical protein
MKPILVAHVNADVGDTVEKLQRVGIKNPVRAIAEPQQLFEYLEGKDGFSDRTHHPLPVLVFLDAPLAASSQWKAAQKRLDVRALVRSPEIFDFTEQVNMTKGIFLRPTREGMRVEEVDF